MNESKVNITPSKKFKICMVGDFAVGKTSLTQRFVNNVFSEKYLTTIGVKIDSIVIGDSKLIVWDVAGRDSLSPINANYLVGAAGIVLVGDGTRPETIDAFNSLAATVEQRIGQVPIVVALNKQDHKDWQITDAQNELHLEKSWEVVNCSAKTGDNVAEIFHHLLDKLGSVK